MTVMTKRQQRERRHRRVRGRVSGTSRLHPTRPKVEVLLDSRGQPLKPPRQMVLEEEPMVYIVNPAIEEDV